MNRSTAHAAAEYHTVRPSSASSQKGVRMHNTHVRTAWIGSINKKNQRQAWGEAKDMSPHQESQAWIWTFSFKAS
jgi:hypothetical protein